MWNAFGWLMVCLGFAGYALPGVPGTVFLVAALWCFRKGSPRFERWLLGHRLFGPVLSRWDAERSLTRRTKQVAVGSVWVFVPLSSVALWPYPWVLAALLALGVYGTWFILSRPTARPELEPAQIEG